MIKFHTKYRVDYGTDKLISEAAKAMQDDLQMPHTKASSIKLSTYSININDEGVSGNIVREKEVVYSKHISIPDALSYIQSKTELTRDTILKILKESGKIKELLINPQMFLDNVVKVIKNKLTELMVDGIEYKKIDKNGTKWLCLMILILKYILTIRKLLWSKIHQKRFMKTSFR